MLSLLSLLFFVFFLCSFYGSKMLWSLCQAELDWMNSDNIFGKKRFFKSLLSEKNLGWWRRYKVEFSSLLYVGSCWCAKEKNIFVIFPSKKTKYRLNCLQMQSNIFKILNFFYFKLIFFIVFKLFCCYDIKNNFLK